jgi:hypothetical protein
MTISDFTYRINGRVLRYLAPYLSDKLFIKLFFRHKKGYWMNFNHPTTFCEKLQWLKLNNKREDFTLMVDKAEAKKFVASIIGEQYIIPTFGIYNSFEEIDFKTLPNQFILKCTHNSSGGFICKDKNTLDLDKAKLHFKTYFKQNYFIQNREYPYKKVPHRIIAEKYMVNGYDEELKDYKFYCFNGKAEYCQLISDRSTNETIDFYDREWTHQIFIGLNPKAKFAKNKENKPYNYSEMLYIADKIAKKIDTPFVRVDLYNINHMIYFGEITFFPMSGIGSFKPEEWDIKLGNMMILRNNIN